MLMFGLFIALYFKQSLVLIWGSNISGQQNTHQPIITTFWILWAIALTIGLNDCHTKILEILLPVKIILIFNVTKFTHIRQKDFGLVKSMVHLKINLKLYILITGLQIVCIPGT